MTDIVEEWKNALNQPRTTYLDPAIGHDMAERTIKEITRLRAELAKSNHDLDKLRQAIKDKGGNEHSPTQWAYDKACKALQKHKAELAKHEWQPIETAPKDETEIIVTNGTKTEVCTFGPVSKSYCGKEKDYITNKEGFGYGDWQYGMRWDIVNPTHWQPLPAPPEEKE